MPVIIAPENFDPWLETLGGREIALALLQPFPSEALEAYAVSTCVNKLQNAEASLIEAFETDR